MCVYSAYSSMTLIKKQSSGKLFCYPYHSLIEILLKKNDALNPISVAGILLCLAILSSLIVIQDFYSAFLYLLHAFFNFAHPPPERLKPEVCLCNNNKVHEGLTVSKGEVDIVMKNLGILGNHDDGDKVREIMNAADFANVFEDEEPSLGEVKQAFDIFDENKDGFIDAMELKRIFSALGFAKMSEVECRRMIQAFDNNDGDGKIDFREFARLIEKSFAL